MRIFGSAIRASGEYDPKATLLGALATAVLLPVTAFLLMWLVPAGCDIRGDAELYRWTCLLPGLLVVVPIVLAVILALADFLNHRSGRRFPDGWLVTVLAAGILTYVALTGSYLIALGPAYHSMFVEVLLIPQPFVAGVIAGTVFWLTLQLARAQLAPK